MDKKTFYVSVQAGDVLEDPDVAAFEFEIEATDDQVALLQDLMDEWSQGDSRSPVSMFSYMGEEHSDDTRIDNYDARLERIYRYIHKLGTPETKRHIESMNVMHDLQDESRQQ